MNAKLLVGAALFLSCSSFGEQLSQEHVKKLADAIYFAEGGAKTRHPYGILSVKVKSHAEARQVCVRTITNNHARWQKSGSRKDFVDYLADVYCPPSVDKKGNVNWKRNVKELSK